MTSRNTYAEPLPQGPHRLRAEETVPKAAAASLVRQERHLRRRSTQPTLRAGPIPRAHGQVSGGEHSNLNETEAMGRRTPSGRTREDER